MIDFILEYPDVCWGIIEECSIIQDKEDYITIEASEWAPGLWAGITNQVFGIKEKGSSFYKCFIYVKSVNLENRILIIENDPDVPPNLKPGDELFYIKEEK